MIAPLAGAVVLVETRAGLDVVKESLLARPRLLFALLCLANLLSQVARPRRTFVISASLRVTRRQRYLVLLFKAMIVIIVV